MPITKKIIGRIPVCFGTWYEKQGGWGIKNRVTMYGSEFESLHDNNTVPPAVYDDVAQTVTFNESDWRVISNGTEAWLADTKINALGTWITNPEYLRVYTDEDGKVLFGIKEDGSIEWAKGVPTPIKKEIEKVLAKIDETLTAKVAEIEEMLQEMQGIYGIQVDSTEWLRLYVDGEDRVLWGIRADGSIEFSKGIPTPIQQAIKKLYEYVDEKTTSEFDGMFKVISNPEYVYAIVDSEGHFLFGIRTNGEVDWLKGVPTSIKEYVNESVSSIYEDVIAVFNTWFGSVDDPEGRLEATTDKDGKVLSWRDENGVLHENGIKIEKKLDFSEEAMTDFQRALKDAGFQPGGGGDASDKETVELPEPKGYALLNIEIDSLPTNDGEVVEGFAEYYDFAGNYFKKSCALEIQGQSGREFARTGGKGNYTLDITDDSEIKFGDWVPQDSFHLKGNAKDVTRGYLATSYKLAWKVMNYLDAKPNRVLVDESGITTTNATGVRMNDWPDDARCLPDGFPFELYVNGEYWGLYSWQLKKHRKNYSMDKKDYKTFFIDADGNMTDFWSGNIMWNRFEIKNPKDLICMDGSAYDGDNPRELIDETATGIYDSSNKKHKGSKQTKDIIKSFSTKYLAVKAAVEAADDAASIAAAKELFNQYFDYNACMFVYIFNCLMNNTDSIEKNTLWATYNNGKIAPMLWDLDGVYGEGWVGNIISAPSAAMWSGSYATSEWPLSLFWALYQNEIMAAYAELRDSIVTMDTWRSVIYGEWIDRIGKEAFERDIKRWPETPSYRENNINTDYWRGGHPVYGQVYPLWDEETQYNQGDVICMRLSNFSSWYMRFTAVQPSIGESPVTGSYDIFPYYGGCYDSPKRMEKWMEEQIRLCDIAMGYNQ